MKQSMGSAEKAHGKKNPLTENYRAANEFKVEKWIEVNVAEASSIFLNIIQTKSHLEWRRTMRPMRISTRLSLQPLYGSSLNNGTSFAFIFDC